ncbi:MAG TPA: SprB repeat-containing protein, partial [Saprospiraceae bacterium]|nr:SprB repeat-containing protein [Saprospiraceae bacterium]
MQRPKLTLLIPVLLASSLLFLSNSGNPPDGRTNAPFDGFCSDCHGGGTYDGIVDIAGLPATIMPNTTYSITLTATATNGSPVRGGFQLVSVNSSNQNFGDLSNTSGETGTSMSGGREYIDHRGAKNFSGNTVSWSFNWTSPNGPSGSMVTMYFAANLTNGNGSTSGDRPISASKTATMTGGGNPLVASISSKKNVSCFGGNDGDATATATGGQPGYSYAWSNGQNGNMATGLTSGNYIVTVTDMAGTTATANASITQPTLLRHNLQILRHVSCPNGTDGAVTASATGGIAPYNFNYSTGSPNNLRAGIYTVTVTDANSCSSSSSFEILEPDSFAISLINLDNPDCPRDSNGLIQIAVTGATSPYKYKWSNGETTSSIGNLGIGNYMVTITDAKNCNAVRGYTLSSLDTTAPLLETKDGRIYLNANGWAIPDLMSFIANRQDNCDNNPQLFWNLDTIRCSQTGKLSTSISARDYSGNVTQKSVEIEVFDTIKPVIQIWPDTSFYSCDIQVPNVQAFDACGLEYFRQLSGPLPGERFPFGQSVLKYEAKDLSGNSHMDSLLVNVIHPVTAEIDSQYFEICSGNQIFTRINFQH